MYKKTMKKIFNKKGYSLLELVIYLALFAALSMVLVNIAVVGYKAYRTVRVNRDFTENGLLAIERISRTVRSATDASNSSTFGSNPGVLILTTSTGTSTFDVSNGALRLTETTASGTTVGNITGGIVTVSSLVFDKITTSKGQAIKTAITLTYSATSRSETFYVTTILRGAY